MALAVQSIQKRLPEILGPLVSGFVLGAATRVADRAEEGFLDGMHLLVGTALGLGVISLSVQLRWMPHVKALASGPPAWQIVRDFHPLLRRLLLAEAFTRWC